MTRTGPDHHLIAPVPDFPEFIDSLQADKPPSVKRILADPYKQICTSGVDNRLGLLSQNLPQII